MKSSINTSSERKPQKWQHLHQSQARYVRPPSSRIIGQQTPWKTSQKNTDTNKASWYLAFGNATQDRYSSHWLSMTSVWNMLAKNMHIISRMHLKNTTNLVQLDRQMVHRDNIGLGLQQVTGSSVHAKLHAESFEIISTQSRQTTACTIPKCPNPICRKETICNTRIKGATVRRQSQVVHPTGMRQVFIPWQSSW